jgi:flagellar hook-associated protein 2
MASALSSLGIGSGVLTADIIDKLKGVDENSTIKPIESKISLNSQKQESFSLLSSYMNLLKGNSSALKYDTMFYKNSISTSGDVGVTIDSGASIPSFTLETTTLAKKDITKFGAMADKDTTYVAGGSGVLKINNFEIPYTSTTTLADLSQSINDIAGSSVSSSILKSAEGEYNLVISSKETGSTEALTITDTDDGTLGTGSLNSALFAAYDPDTNPYGYEKIQTASDATFKYNGITMTRSSNTIDDIASGLHVTLKKEGDNSNITVSSDYSELISEIESFVENYNTLTSNLYDMTTYNQDTGMQGVFNNDTFVKSISRELSKAVFSTNGSGDSLANYGISIAQDGTMSFDSSVLEEKLEDDADSVRLFFSGGTDTDGNTVTGIFTSIDESLASYTDSGELLSVYEESLENEATKLGTNKTAAQASIDSKYDLMSTRFAQYDAMINRINAQFSSLKMMIDAEGSSE